MTTPAPGWYPDPGKTADLRWWDGQAWTSHTRAATPPAAAAPFAPAQLPTAALTPAQPITPAQQSQFGIQPQAGQHLAMEAAPTPAMSEVWEHSKLASIAFGVLALGIVYALIKGHFQYLYIFGFPALILAVISYFQQERLARQAIAATAVAVVVGFLSYHLHSSSHHASSGALAANTNSVAVANLRNLAALEESIHARKGVYSNDFQDFPNGRLGLVPGSQGGLVEAGVDPSKGYCLIASDPPSETSKTWYLYDSQNGGLQTKAYDSPYTAEAACSDHSIKVFPTVI